MRKLSYQAKMESFGCTGFINPTKEKDFRDLTICNTVILVRENLSPKTYNTANQITVF